MEGGRKIGGKRARSILSFCFLSPKAAHFSEMREHLATGHVFEDHVQIRVILERRRKRVEKTANRMTQR